MCARLESTTRLALKEAALQGHQPLTLTALTTTSFTTLVYEKQIHKNQQHQLLLCLYPFPGLVFASVTVPVEPYHRQRK